MCITASQIQWTADVTKALGLTKERGDQRAIKSLKKKQVAMLNKMSEAIRSNLTKQQRMKIVALVTIEVHARDILEKLIKTKTSDGSAFEWLSQLRVYWDRVSCFRAIPFKKQGEGMSANFFAPRPPQELNFQKAPPPGI